MGLRRGPSLIRNPIIIYKKTESLGRATRNLDLRDSYFNKGWVSQIIIHVRPQVQVIALIADSNSIKSLTTSKAEYKSQPIIPGHELSLCLSCLLGQSLITTKSKAPISRN